MYSAADAAAAAAASAAELAQSAAGTIARNRFNSFIFTVSAWAATSAHMKGVSQRRVHITSQMSMMIIVACSSRHTTMSTTGVRRGLRIPAASIVR